MQDDLRQHLGLQKSDAASVAACATAVGYLKGANRAGRPSSATRVADLPSSSSKCKPVSGCLLEGKKPGGSEFQTMFRWASHTSIPESTNLDCPLGNSLHASPGAGVRYCQDGGQKPQRPMSAPARRRACMQASNRPHSASRHRGSGTLAGTAMVGSKPRDLQRVCTTTQHAAAHQSRWQGKTAYRHESTAIRSKLAKQRHRPVSEV